MTSGEMARKAGVSQKAIRLYDEKGLLKPTEYSEGNYRLYDDAALQILEKIVALKQIGFSLEEIRDNLKSGEASSGIATRNDDNRRRISMNAREYLDILHVAEKLKDTPRHCTTTYRRTESVAEHSWRISLMAFLLRHEFPELDIDKVVDMCLIHDLGECFTGDIPTFIKTDYDREVEDSLLNRWVKSLPEELSKDIADLYKEMDAQETKEAKLYKALDKLEALIQHNESPIDTWSENEYELNKTYAFDTVSFSEWLTELRKAVLDDTLKKIDEGK